MSEQTKQNPEGAAQPAKPGKKWKKRLLRFCICLLALLVLLAGFVWFFAFCKWGLFGLDNPYCVRPPQRSPEELGYSQNGIEYKYNKDMLNILLLGVDEDYGNIVTAGKQADVVLLLSLNTRTGQATLLPIPRDTTAPVMHLDIYGEVAHTQAAPLCTAHAYGQTPLQSGQLMEATVSYLMYEIPVHRFASVDMAAVKYLTDYVGGVPVEVTADFSLLASDLLGRPVQEGETILLDGEKAEQYLRARSAGNMDGTNLSRMVRQRKYLFALLETVLGRVKQNVFFALGLYREMKPYLNTNLSLREMAFIGQKILFAKGGTLQEKLALQVMEGEMVGLEYQIDNAFLRQYVRDTYFIPA